VAVGDLVGVGDGDFVGVAVGSVIVKVKVQAAPAAAGSLDGTFGATG